MEFSCFIGKSLMREFIRNFILFFFADSDWPLYLGLTVITVVCIALGAALIRTARRGRHIPPYNMARTGKLLHFFFLKDFNEYNIQSFKKKSKINCLKILEVLLLTNAIFPEYQLNYLYILPAYVVEKPLK